ncbi:MAG: hypothetical protein AAF552_17480 [Pseudomonadota bacterium]
MSGVGHSHRPAMLEDDLPGGALAEGQELLGFLPDELEREFEFCRRRLTGRLAAPLRIPDRFANSSR